MPNRIRAAALFLLASVALPVCTHDTDRLQRGSELEGEADAAGVSSGGTGGTGGSGGSESDGGGITTADAGPWFDAGEAVDSGPLNDGGRDSGDAERPDTGGMDGAPGEDAADGEQAPVLFPLSVVSDGAGNGTVTSEPEGIDCGATCVQDFADGESVTLTATPDGSSEFTGWGGDCTGTGSCTLIMDGTRSVTATFAVKTYQLSITKSGAGLGTITSEPEGIDCGIDCDALFEIDTKVTLSITPSPTSIFDGWSGDCDGTSDCVVTMDTARNVTANLSLQAFSLAVHKAGNGTGTVTSVNVAGIDCGIDCDETFDPDTPVTLTAVPDASSIFTGWSDDCDGTSDCSLTMSTSHAVTATFTLKSFQLDVGKSGDGDGTVTATGIDCGSDCNQTYDYGTVVTLNQTPIGSSRFTGWSGDCNGAGGCQVTMTAPRNVTATFELPYSHTIVIDGTNDFAAADVFTTTSTVSAGYTGYISWDETNLYFGMDGMAVGEMHPGKFLLIYLDGILPGGPGTTDGVPYGSQQPLLPFEAGYHFRWKADNTYTNGEVYDASNWIDAGWDFAGDVYQYMEYIEVRIPLADIGNPTTVKVHMCMVNEMVGEEWTFAGVPDTSFANGDDPDYGAYFEFDLGSPAVPNSYSPLP